MIGIRFIVQPLGFFFFLAFAACGSGSDVNNSDSEGQKDFIQDGGLQTESPDLDSIQEAEIELDHEDQIDEPPECNNECKKDERQCITGINKEGFQVCGNYDDDSCLEWSEIEMCENNSICDAETATCITSYPPGPYGSDKGDTIKNICLEECICSGATPTSTRMVCMEEFLDKEVTLLTVHAGFCSTCEAQAATMEANLYQPLKDQGLGILLTYITDRYGDTSRNKLLKLCCQMKHEYDMSFSVTIDPGADVTHVYSPHDPEMLLPINVIIDDNMVIQKIFTQVYSGVKKAIKSILDED